MVVAVGVFVIGVSVVRARLSLVTSVFVVPAVPVSLVTAVAVSFVTGVSMVLCFSVTVMFVAA
jgi:hypothetical protein